MTNNQALSIKERSEELVLTICNLEMDYYNKEFNMQVKGGLKRSTNLLYFNNKENKECIMTIIIDESNTGFICYEEVIGVISAHLIKQNYLGSKEELYDYILKTIPTSHN